MVVGVLASSPATVLWSVLGLAFLWQVKRLVDYTWWRPRRLQRALHAQGLRGTPYRFLVGDLGDYGRQSKETPRALPLRCHDIRAHVAPYLYNTVQEHGKTCVSWFGPIPKVIVADPGIAREVMSNKLGHFEKLHFPALTRLFAGGVAVHEGEKWVKHRRILNPAFHLEKLKLMMPAFSTCCEELVNQWTRSLGSNGCCEVDVCPEFHTLTGDVISRTAFGSSYLQGRRFLELQSKQADRIVALKKVFIPGYLSLPTKKNKQMHQTNNEIEFILRGLVEKRIQGMQQGESTKDDLLGLMLESNMRETNDKGLPILGITIEEVIEECKLFYFAGTETTSVLLTWTMVVLGMHPEWHTREDVLGLFGKNKPEYDGFSKLKTMTMIPYEVLRLYLPAVAFTRKTYKEIEIGSITYPAGVIIELPMLLIHHDLNIWGSDVHEFKPERFADGISKSSKDPGAFLPFGRDPRICIGQNFALLEAKMALCIILQHFEFDLAPTYSHVPHNVKMLCPMHGAHIKLRAI